MAQENYSILPLMGIDVSASQAITGTQTSNAIGCPANPIATLANNSPTVQLTVTTPSNFSVGQWITVAGVSGTVGNISAANLNISAQVLAVGTTYITYNANANANGAATGGGSAVTVTVNNAPMDFQPGDRVVCADGTERMFVKCELGSNPANSTNIAQYDVVLVDNTGRAQSITTTLATIAAANGSPAWTIGVSPMAITYSATTPGFGWVITRGQCVFNVSAAVAIGTPMYTTATAGQLSTTSAASMLVIGLMNLVATTAAGSVLGNASNPVLGLKTGGSI